jgi:hypothetical protein
MDLQGTTPRPNARTGQPGDSVPITTKATITVEVIH